jgi:hypothetical protein
MIAIKLTASAHPDLNFRPLQRHREMHCFHCFMPRYIAYCEVNVWLPPKGHAA